ncbi:MAG: GNAT family N-acetyltransferase [Lactimicrobium sp.]|jgi:ribosomal protein S18 acetylase RimI-like enzyme|uniref:GNAT family N-acetyltransferase n=1 Tax=Lactimicrobium sp. TaxID=2563780 RepID=UPI002F359E01
MEISQTQLKENKQLDIAAFSHAYKVKHLQEEDIPVIFDLCRRNVLYYQYCPPMVTKESILSDLHALPDGAVLSQKYDIGYYQNHQLMAILDLIAGWPDEETAYIGLFMMDVSLQRKGIGSNIIQDLQNALKQAGFERIRLGWMQDNPQAEHFWRKNGFVPCNVHTAFNGKTAVIAEKMI